LLYVPAPHGVHLALPSAFENDPTLQSVQFQDAAVSLTVPTPHLWHDFMPVMLPNSPGKQGKHEAWPSDF
jgi:hypothetical protein